MIYAKEFKEITQFALDSCIEVENKIEKGDFSKRELRYMLNNIEDTFKNTIDFIKDKIRENK